MSVDLTAELFAVDLFRHLWYKFNIVTIIVPRLKPYSIQGQPEELILSVCHAVWCRHQLFKRKLLHDVMHRYKEFSETGIDFCSFILNTVDKSMPVKEMNIFERLFMSCAFVIEMAFCCKNNDNRIHMNKAPYSWCMYFDIMLKDQFFNDGGWDILYQYSYRYANSALLREQSIQKYCVDECDVVNAMSLFCCISESYSLPTIISSYFNRCVERSAIVCKLCEPLLNVLHVEFSDIVPDKADSELTEGYLQLILKLLTDEEIKSICEDTKLKYCKDLSDTDESNALNISQDHDHDHCKQIAAECFMNRIFTEKGQCLLESESQENSDLKKCIFCSSTNLTSESRETTFSKLLKRIKSFITVTIDTENSCLKREETSETVDLNSENQAKVQEQKKFSLKLATNIKKEEKLNSEMEVTENADHQKIFFGEKDLLKMFAVLGCEESKALVLSSIKEGLKAKEAVLEVVDNLSLEKEQNVGNAKSKPKKKKTKNKKKVTLLPMY